MLPEEPPIKAWVGTGRSTQASGASPSTISRLSAANFSLFLYNSSTASGFFSIAYTRPSTACIAISTDTEPVPAPTS